MHSLSVNTLMIEFVACSNSLMKCSFFFLFLGVAQTPRYCENGYHKILKKDSLGGKAVGMTDQGHLRLEPSELVKSPTLLSEQGNGGLGKYIQLKS